MLKDETLRDAYDAIISVWQDVKDGGSIEVLKELASAAADLYQEGQKRGMELASYSQTGEGVQKHCRVCGRFVRYGTGNAYFLTYAPGYVGWRCGKHANVWPPRREVQEKKMIADDFRRFYQTLHPLFGRVRS